ncbi:MAG TPA: phosphotyrosine protein phosphatase [Bacteroidia bacterium]
MTNVLFVCSANKQRSKTAEDHFSILYPKFNFLSAGTNRKICDQEGTTFITEDLIEWADTIFVMEKKHRKQINEYLKQKSSSKIKVLNIKDIYKYNSKELILLLNEKLTHYFKNN